MFSQKPSKKEPEKRKSLSEEDGKKEIMKNDAQDGGPVAKKARVQEHKVAAKTAQLVANGDGAASEKQPLPQNADKETPAEETVAEPDRSYQLCKHDVMIPPGYQGSLGQDLYNPPFPEAPARQYPFTLDPFQV